MQRLVSAFCATAMMLSMTATANSGVLQAPSIPARSNVIQVQGMDYSGEGYYADDYRRYGDRFVRRGDIHYWRGHRGSRHPRPGYRRHGGWWFPSAAFIAGAIIGGTQPSMSSAHVRWCHSRYKSYRQWDNTFQPYRGPRRQCISPYRR